MAAGIATPFINKMPAHLMRYFFAYRFYGTGNLYRLHNGGLVQAAFGRAVSC
jgi:hypothetical protein